MAAVWCISLVTASPIILLSVLKPEAVLAVDDQQRYQCAITSRYFLSYGSLTAFFIPLFIMLFAYSLTIHLLKRQAQHGIRRSQNRPAKRRKLTEGRHGNNVPAKMYLGDPPSVALSSSNGGSLTVSCSDDDWQHRGSGKSLLPRSARRDTSVVTWLTSGDSDATPSGECTSKRDNNLYADVDVVSRETSPCRGGSDNEIMHPRVTETSPSSPEDNSAAAKPILGSMTSPTTTIQRRRNDLPRPALPAGGVRGKVKLRDVVRKHSAAITAAGILIQNQDICRRRESSVRTERKAVKVRTGSTTMLVNLHCA